jgi:hypothetical protein
MYLRYACNPGGRGSAEIDELTETLNRLGEKLVASPGYSVAQRERYAGAIGKGSSSDADQESIIESIIELQTEARPLNSFIESQNLGAGATVTVGNGAASVGGQGIINITIGDLPLSGEPLSPSGFAYGVIEIIPRYFYASATVSIPVCFAPVVDLGSGPFSTTHPTVENIAFTAGDGNWHV